MVDDAKLARLIALGSKLGTMGRQVAKIDEALKWLDEHNLTNVELTVVGDETKPAGRRKRAKVIELAGPQDSAGLRTLLLARKEQVTKFLDELNLPIDALIGEEAIAAAERSLAGEVDDDY